MKIAIVGFLALVAGVGGGAFVGGVRVRDEILAERALEHASAAAQVDHEPVAPEAGNDGSEGGQPVELGVEPDAAQAAPDPADDPVGSGAEPDSSTTAGDSASDPRPVDEGAAEATTAEPETATSAIPAAAAAALAQADSAAIAGAIKLSRIFSAMKPVDAAAVLQQMTDIEVEAILQHMQARLAGQVLGEFEPGRAASLSRVVLKGRAGS